jgi:non-haem dioxygenase in morphine synthesis N-terminal
MICASAQADQNFHVPVVNFSKFWSGSPQDRLAVSNEVVRAFKEVGFLYIKNHNIDQNIIARTFHEVRGVRTTYDDDIIDSIFPKSDEFFKLPQEVKDQLAWEGPLSTFSFRREYQLTFTWISRSSCQSRIRQAGSRESHSIQRRSRNCRTQTHGSRRKGIDGNRQ